MTMNIHPGLRHEARQELIGTFLLLAGTAPLIGLILLGIYLIRQGDSGGWFFIVAGPLVITGMLYNAWMMYMVRRPWLRRPHGSLPAVNPKPCCLNCNRALFVFPESWPGCIGIAGPAKKRRYPNCISWPTASKTCGCFCAASLLRPAITGTTIPPGLAWWLPRTAWCYGDLEIGNKFTNTRRKSSSAPNNRFPTGRFRIRQARPLSPKA